MIFAKTTCPDYGMLSSGLSSFHPLTRNPWKLSENPGGSSAGAAAAGADGFGPLHIGNPITKTGWEYKGVEPDYVSARGEARLARGMNYSHPQGFCFSLVRPR